MMATDENKWTARIAVCIVVTVCVSERVRSRIQKERELPNSMKQKH